MNLVVRGTLEKPKRLVLCEKAQNEYDAFVAIQVVPFGQLYGGKICAALDRQHPRDLFDVKYLLESDGFSEAVKQGFLLCLVGSNRSIHEILSPNLLDQRAAMQNQFEGMSSKEFTYEEFEATRNQLISVVNQSLTLEDKKFLLSIQDLKPDWSLYDFSYFPAVKWKLKNLLNLKNQNPQKYKDYFEILESHLFLHERTNILGKVLSLKKRTELEKLLENAMQQKADINQSWNGHKPLQCLIRSQLEKRKKLKWVKKFIDLGADINKSDASGLTPYQVAIVEKDKDILDYLIFKGANPKSPPGTDYTKHYEMYHTIPIQ